MKSPYRSRSSNMPERNRHLWEKPEGEPDLDALTDKINSLVEIIEGEALDINYDEMQVLSDEAKAVVEKTTVLTLDAQRLVVHIKSLSLSDVTREDRSRLVEECHAMVAVLEEAYRVAMATIISDTPGA